MTLGFFIQSRAMLEPNLKLLKSILDHTVIRAMIILFAYQKTVRENSPDIVTTKSINDGFDDPPDGH